MGRQLRAESAMRRGNGMLDVKKVSSDRDKTTAARARQRAIGRELSRIYDEVVQEKVPDEFLELLTKIDETAGKKDATA